MKKNNHKILYPNFENVPVVFQTLKYLKKSPKKKIRYSSYSTLYQTDIYMFTDFYKPISKLLSSTL